MRKLLVLVFALSVAGCSLFKEGIASCSEVQPYEGSEELPPLKVPEGVDQPSTSNALKIPVVRGGPRQRPKDRCLDEPPDYYAKPGQATSPLPAGEATPPAAGAAVPATTGGTLDVEMDAGRPWETRVGVLYQTEASADFEGGTAVEFADSAGFMVGVGYDLTSHFEIGANFSYDQRDYDATIAGDDPDEAYAASGRLDSMGVVLDLTYNLLSGPLTPFVVAGVGWNWVDTRIEAEPPQVGCWWSPWYGYVCTTFQDTKTIDGVTYQVGAGVRYHLNRSFSLSGSYRMSWVDFPNATSTPSLNTFQLVVGWRF